MNSHDGNGENRSISELYSEPEFDKMGTRRYTFHILSILRIPNTRLPCRSNVSSRLEGSIS